LTHVGFEREQHSFGEDYHTSLWLEQFVHSCPILTEVESKCAKFGLILAFEMPQFRNEATFLECKIALETPMKGLLPLRGCVIDDLAFFARL